MELMMPKLTKLYKSHGGKHYLAPKYLKYIGIPEHEWFGEYYAGGASYLLAKPRSQFEILVERNEDIAALWTAVKYWPEKMQQCLRDLSLCEETFLYWKKQSADAMDYFDRGLRTFIVNRMSRQGLGRCFLTPSTRSRRGMPEHESAWLSAIDAIPAISTRLIGVDIKHGLATDYLRHVVDQPHAFVFLDPPYLHSTRSTTNEYGANEMLFIEHVELLTLLASGKCKFLLCGYPSDLYRSFAQEYGWNSRQFPTANHSSASATKETKPETAWWNFRGTLA